MNIDHAGYIAAAYAITAFVIIGLVASIVIEHRALARALAKLPSRESGDEGA